MSKLDSNGPHNEDPDPGRGYAQEQGPGQAFCESVSVLASTVHKVIGKGGQTIRRIEDDFKVNVRMARVVELIISGNTEKDVRDAVECVQQLTSTDPVNEPGRKSSFGDKPNGNGNSNPPPSKDNLSAPAVE